MPGIRPLLKLSYALNHASGFGVVGFHAVNVAIHAGNAFVAMVIADRLGKRSQSAVTGSEERVGETLGNRGFPLAAALVFALHPLQTEAVVYASGRSASLSTGLALWSIAIGVGAQESGKPRPWFIAASLGCMAMALAVKESAVVVPAVLVLWRATDPDRPACFRELLRVAAPHWFLLSIVLAIGLVLPAYQRFVDTSLAIRSPLENLIAQVRGVQYLLGQMVRIDRLNADPALPAVARLDAESTLFAVLLMAVFGLAIAMRRRASTSAFAVLWTAIWLAPTNSLLARFDLVNDRQAYGALLGPALFVGLAWKTLAVRSRSLAVLLLLVCSIGLGVATHRRNEVYRDEVVFWQTVARQSPHNARAFNNLGVALADGCKDEAAIHAWRRALELDSGFVRAAVNLRLALDGAMPRKHDRCQRAP